MFIHIFESPIREKWNVAHGGGVRAMCRCQLLLKWKFLCERGSIFFISTAPHLQGIHRGIQKAEVVQNGPPVGTCNEVHSVC